MLCESLSTTFLAADESARLQKDDSDDEYEEGGSKSRRRSPDSDDESGSDMEQSDDDDRGAKKKGKGKKAPAPVVELADLLQIQVTRTKLAEMCRAPWFEEWIKGAFASSSASLPCRG